MGMVALRRCHEIAARPPVPRSIASKSALKFPLPKPRLPFRWMISKNSVGRSSHRPGEELQQVAFLVAIDEDAERPDRRRSLRRSRRRAAAARRSSCRARSRNSTPFSRSAPTGALDVGGEQRDVLHAGAAVVVEVLLDLALALARGRLVDRELDRMRVVGHHDAHERAVFGRDVLVVEADVAREAEHAAVPVGPLVHLAELDVADHVVDAQDAGLLARDSRADEAWQERPVVVDVRDERVDRVAVGLDRGVTHAAMLVLQRRAARSRARRRAAPPPRTPRPRRRRGTRCRARRRRASARARRPAPSATERRRQHEAGLVLRQRVATRGRAGRSRGRRRRTARNRRPCGSRRRPAWRCRPGTRRDECSSAAADSLTCRDSLPPSLSLYNHWLMAV